MNFIHNSTFSKEKSAKYFNRVLDIVEEKLYRAKARVMVTIRDNLGSDDNPLASNLNQTLSTTKFPEDIKLQRLRIRKFWVSYDHWITFYDLYVQSTNENQVIALAQNLQYLHNC